MVDSDFYLVEPGDFCTEFYRNSKSKKLVVFLPSVRSKKIYPYYPRLSWGRGLSSYLNVLFVADPFQDDEYFGDAGGSWYISKDGKTILPVVAERVKDFCDKQGIDEICYYGSSMGGYAAIILATLTPEATAVAECPQTFLNKHPNSRMLMEKMGVEDPSVFEPLHFLGSTNSNAKIKIICSLHDQHYNLHVLPFVEKSMEAGRDNVDIDILGYSREKYKKGHIALDKEDAFNVINSVMNLSKIS